MGAQLTSSDGYFIHWIDQIWYSGIHIAAGRQLICSVTHAKRSTNRSTNAIFEKK